MTNYDKVLKNIEDEHARLTDWVSVLQNPIYAVDLQAKLDEYNRNVIKLKREKKHLEDNSKMKTKRMDVMLGSDYSDGKQYILREL